MADFCVVKDCFRPAKSEGGMLGNSCFCEKHQLESFKPEADRIAKRMEIADQHTHLVVGIRDGRIKQQLEKHGVSDEVIESVFKELVNE